MQRRGGDVGAEGGTWRSFTREARPKIFRAVAPHCCTPRAASGLGAGEAAGAAGLAFGGAEQIYLIQMAMLFAGIATLFQTIGAGPIGGRLPIM